MNGLVLFDETMIPSQKIYMNKNLPQEYLTLIIIFTKLAFVIMIKNRSQRGKQEEVNLKIDF